MQLKAAFGGCLLLVLAGCATLGMSLTPTTQVYALQREFNELYLPEINRYAVQEFCDATANPPVVVQCADAKTVKVLNTVVQETKAALTVARVAVRSVEAACALPTSLECTETTKYLALATETLRAVLARVSATFIQAGLDK